jgi:hypothetical protein
MIFRISDIASPGELAHERVVMRASAAGDLGDYAIFRAFISPDGVALSGDVPRAYWFPELLVKPDDLVVLYTKEGVRSEKVLNSGRKTYFFYWGRSTTMWDDQKYIATVVNTENWDFSRKTK